MTPTIENGEPDIQPTSPYDLLEAYSEDFDRRHEEAAKAGEKVTWRWQDYLLGLDYELYAMEDSAKSDDKAKWLETNDSLLQFRAVLELMQNRIDYALTGETCPCCGMPLTETEHEGEDDE